MKSIYDPATRAEVIARIQALTSGLTPRWGKMNVNQMVKHCRLWEELSLGRTSYKRTLMGRIFGRMALGRFLSDERPLPKNTPIRTNMRITICGSSGSEQKRRPIGDLWGSVQTK